MLTYYLQRNELTYINMDLPAAILCPGYGYNFNKIVHRKYDNVAIKSSDNIMGIFDL